MSARTPGPGARPVAARGAALLMTAAAVASVSAPSATASPRAAAASVPLLTDQVPPQSQCLRSTQVYTAGVPWALRRLWPQRAWPLARGNGVLVAVLGSGIDARHPQFAPGQVLPGRDLLRPGAADDDCDGTGTFVAGLVAARQDPRTTVVGLAPDVRLLPVRIMQSTSGGSTAPAPGAMAKGIDYAVAEGAQIVVVYEAATGPSAALRAAVTRATRAGTLVVAGGRSSAGSAGDAGRLYPCGYPAVVAVAAVDVDGAPLAGSCTGADVDIAAPGAALVSTSAGTSGEPTHVSAGDDAPGLAAGYVAGAAALLRSYEPGLTPESAARRLTATASRPATGDRDDGVGWGVVDPYAAMASPVAPSPGRVSGDAFRLPAGARQRPDLSALVVGLWFLGAAALTAIAAATFRSGRARGWRPGRRVL